MENILDLLVENINHIGLKRKYLLNKIGIKTVRDLLLFFPEKFLKEENKLACVEGIFKVLIQKKYKIGKLFILQAKFFDEIIEIYFFNIKTWQLLLPNHIYKLHGHLKFDKKWIIQSPKIIYSNNELIPIYNSSIANMVLNKAINEIISKLKFKEKFYNQMSLNEVLYNLHNGNHIEKSLKALKFLEASLFIFLFQEKQDKYSKLNFSNKVYEILPYKFNNEQQRAFNIIKQELMNEYPMKHLVFAEVGAGKTLIAFAAAFLLLEAGFCITFLVPTITLAQQHANWMIPLLEKEGFKPVLLASSIKKKKRTIKEIYEGKYNFIVGTHAMLYLDSIPNLGLIIIDEMQRFGILQRAKLLENAVRKNLLMLSATPIPRSLNIVLSKFINCTKIEKTVFERNVKTTLHKRENIDLFIEKIINMQKKAYWVMPNIEDADERIGAISRFNYIKEKYNQNIILLHGKMKDLEKLDAIEKFKSCEFGILIATTVIEIGIDIPDADIIVIEYANLFGLSQLHQLRGRIGRRGQEAFCLLLYETFSKKLKFLKELNNGFDIAQADMQLRGAGEWVGLKQHGFSSFSFLNLPQDIEILEEAKEKKHIFDEFEIFIKSYEMSH